MSGVVAMDYETLDPIPLTYGSVAILASAASFRLANFAIRRVFETSTSSSSSSSSSLREIRKNWKWRNIVISWIHAVIVGVWNLICFYCFYQELMSDLIAYHNYYIYTLVAVTTGYFMHDFIDVVMNCPLKESWEILVHHIVVSVAFLINILECRFLGLNVVALLAEANSIFLHARKLLQFSHVPANHWSYRTVIALNLATFVCFRFLCIGWVAYGLFAYYNSFSTPHMLFMSSSTCVMICINIVLFYRLLSRDVLPPMHSSSIHSQQRLNGKKHSAGMENGVGGSLEENGRMLINGDASSVDNNNKKMNNGGVKNWLSSDDHVD